MESKLVQEFQQSDENFLNEAFCNIKDDIISNQIECMYEVMYEEEDNLDIKVYTIMSEIYLRVCLLFGKLKDIKRFKNVLIYDLNKLEINAKLIDDIVNEVLKETTNDKMLPHVLTLAPYVK